MRWNYTKTMGLIVAGITAMQFCVVVEQAPPGSLPEYGSIGAAITYGPIAKPLGDALIGGIMFIVLMMPIGIVSDLVSHWRQKSRARGSLAGVERQPQLSRPE